MITFENAQKRLNVRIRRKSKFGMTMLLSRIRVKFWSPTMFGPGEPGRRFLSWKSVKAIQIWKTRG